MKELVLKRLAAWLIILSLACVPALADSVPGRDAVPEGSEASLLDAGSNVSLAPYIVDGVQKGYYVTSCDKTSSSVAVPAEFEGQPVVHIAANAFKGSKSLKTVVLPDSIQTIGDGAFYDCYNLSSLTLPASAAFLGSNSYSCRDTEGLTVHMTKGSGTMPDFTGAYTWTPWYSSSWYNHPVTVVIDDGVANIGACAFYDCNNLTVVKAGVNVAAAGEYAFYNCQSLEAAPFIDQLNSIGKGAFQNCFLIPEAIVKPGVKAIPDAAFKGCHELKTVVLPDSVETIGDNAFYDCYNLSSLTLPASAAFQGSNSYCCRDTEGLAVHMTKGSGTMPDFTENYTWTPWYSSSWYNHPVTVEIDDGVTNVGAYAFYDCNDLTAVKAGANVAAAGEYAFYNCQSLEAAPFLDQLDSIGKGAFQNCFLIPAAIVKSGVKAIPDSTFRACYALKTVVLPDSIQTIGDSAFYDCYTLSSLTLPASAVFLGSNSYCCRDTEGLAVHMTKGSGTMPDFTESYTWTPWYSSSWYNHTVTVEIDDGVKNIGTYAFYDCNDLATVKAGVNVAAAGDYAFYNCQVLTAAPFINQLDSIGKGAFQNCFIIPEAIVKPGVTAVPDAAFKACHELNTVVLPDSVKTIGDSAFYDCYKLSSLTLPASAVFQGGNSYCCRDTEGLSVHMTKGSGTMPDFTESYTWTPWYSSSWYNHPVTVEIDDGVKNIGTYAFYDCNDLTTVQAGGSVAAAGEYAFYNCQSLEAAPFIDQLDSIGKGAFQNCFLIPSAIVKPGVKAVPDSAFRACYALKTVVLPDSVETIGDSAFYDCYTLSSLTLPASAVFLGGNNYCCRDTKGLSVHLTKGSGTMPDFKTSYSWTPWYSSSWYNHPVTVEADDGVTNFGPYAFYDCNDLKSISIPSTVTVISSYATYKCNAIESVYYNGTREQWSGVSILDNNSSRLTAASITYVEKKGSTIAILDAAGGTAASADYQDLPSCTIVCTFYNARGRMISTVLKPSGNAVFTASSDAVRARVLFLSGDSLIPVRAGEAFALQKA